MEYYKINQSALTLLKQLYLKIHFLSKLTPNYFNTYFNNGPKNKEFMGKESLLMNDVVPEEFLKPFKDCEKYIQNMIQLTESNKMVPIREMNIAKDFIYKYKYPLHINTIGELKQKFLEIENAIKQ